MQENYEELYKSKCKQVEELQEQIKKLELASTNSQTAKLGYLEEVLVCNDLNTNESLRTLLTSFTKCNISGKFERVEHNSKTDITDWNNYFIQVKKTKKNQFGQIHRGWVDDFISHVSSLSTVAYMLKGLCEVPLINDKVVDKGAKRKLLNTENYSEEELSHLIIQLNKNKKEIIKYVIIGERPYPPNYLCCVEYVNKMRKKIIVYKMCDVLDYLANHDFCITNRKSVLSLGKNILTIQRKGGDSGEKSANQIQFKLLCSELNIEKCLKYEL